MELRPGSQHSASETEYFYERLFPRIERLVKADQPVLMREDTLTLLWEEYRADTGAGAYQYTAFCTRYRAWAGIRNQEEEDDRYDQMRLEVS